VRRSSTHMEPEARGQGREPPDRRYLTLVQVTRRVWSWHGLRSGVVMVAGKEAACRGEAEGRGARRGTYLELHGHGSMEVT
jgi:hypothetical protein